MEKQGKTNKFWGWMKLNPKKSMIIGLVIVTLVLVAIVSI